MNQGIIPKRYAKALLAFAKENKSEDAAYLYMSTLAETFFKLPALREALGNPLVSKAEKASLISNAAGGKLDDVMKRFVDLVLLQKREKNLQSIALMYLDLYRKEKNIHLGHLTTATEVSEAEKQKIKEMMTTFVPEGTFEFKTSTNPKLLGGFILNIDFRELDASIATQLRRMKDQFMEQNRKSI